MRTIGLTLLVLVVALGCVSTPLKIPTSQGQTLNKDYEVLGEGEGEATGIMILMFIPVGQNDRFERAYERALKSKGGDRLIDPIITERWYFFDLFNLYVTKISGTVVRDIKK